MKLSGKRYIPLLALLLLLAGCSSKVREEDIAGKTYCYEKDGFGGPFTIQLEEDGSFTYYEGYLSSYIGTGDWTLEGNVVTLQEKTQNFTFWVKDDSLIFQARNSGEFLYLKVKDGEKFLESETQKEA